MSPGFFPELLCGCAGYGAGFQGLLFHLHVDLDVVMGRIDVGMTWGVQNAWAISCGFSGNFELVPADFS